MIFETVRKSEHAEAEKIYRAILAGANSEEEQNLSNRTLKIHHLPIRDDKGEIIYGMVMVFDITDLKQSQTELEKRATLLQRSNEELERFAYVASHDLQGPLRTIASYLQLLELRYKDQLDTEALEFIDFSVNGAKRMQSLIMDLLNYSRISSVTKPFIETDLNKILDDVKRGLESTIKNNNAKIIVHRLPLLMVEPNQIYQLFQNLIDNAIKFKAPGRNPEIKISVEERDSDFLFSICDNGIGIEEKFYNRIFVIFQRLHTRNEYEGTGIGLAVCKKIVERHGGEIWVESKKNEGTTFFLTIKK